MSTDLTPEKLRELADGLVSASRFLGNRLRAIDFKRLRSCETALRALADEREPQAADEAEIRAALINHFREHGRPLAASTHRLSSYSQETSFARAADAILALPAIRSVLTRV